MILAKKFVSVIAALAMVATAGWATALADDTVITIEGESTATYDSFLFSSKDAMEGLSGDAYGNFRSYAGSTFDASKAKITYSFDVSDGGYYSLAITASKPNNTNYSPYAISVDDGEAVAVENGTTATKTADVLGGQIFGAYKMNSDYLLTSGSHTVTVQMLSVGANRSDGRGYVFIDKIDFTLGSTIPSLKVSGGDSHTISNSIVNTYTEQSGDGTYPVFKSAGGVTCPDEGVVAEYSFTAPKKGMYNMTVSANTYDGNNRLSKYAIAVNDGAYNAIDDTTVTARTQTDGLIYKHETSINVQLEEGVNTLQFKITSGRASDNRVYCFLDYVEFAEVEVTDYVLVKGVSSHTTNSAAINGNYAESTTEIPGALVIKTLSGQTFPTAGVVLNYSMYAPATGYYRMTIASNQHDIANMSNYAVSVNGDEYIDINEANAGVSAKPNGGMSATSEKVIGIYNTTEIFYLTEGENTLSYKLTSPREADGRGYSALEYIKFSPVEAECDSVKIESTAPHGVGFVYSDDINESIGVRYASNAYELNAKASAFTGDNLYATFSTVVAKKGKYKLTIAASEFSGRAWLSPYAVSVNGGSEVEINADNAGSAAKPNGGWDTNYPNVNTEATQQDVIGIYNTTSEFVLNEGVNKVTFKVTGLTGNGDKAIAALGWMQFDYVGEASDDEGTVTFGMAYFSTSGAEWYIENGTANSVSMNIIYSKYTSDGRFTGCELKPVVIASGDTSEPSFLGSADIMKLMAWDANLQPLTVVKAN